MCHTSCSPRIKEMWIGTVLKHIACWCILEFLSAGLILYLVWLRLGSLLSWSGVASLGFHWKAETLWPSTHVTIHSYSLFFPFLLFGCCLEARCSVTNAPFASWCCSQRQLLLLFFFFAGFHGFLQGRYIVSKALQFVQDRDTFLTSEQYVHKSYETFFPLSFLQF
jgi:hypothetical protein